MRYFFFFFFFILTIGLVVVYINISSVDIKPKKEIKIVQKTKKEENNIIRLLAKANKEDIFPAKELFLKVNLDKIPKTTILYQTIINNLNKYQLFGIEQILELNNIRYSIIKSKNDLKLFINFDKKSQANKIQKLFRNYNFNVKLKEVKIKG